jgi:ATP-binding cassette subfamily C protein EexD
MIEPSQLGRLHEPQSARTSAPAGIIAQFAAFVPGSTRRAAVMLVGFSLMLNLLQLALPIYSMQVYDRVLPSGSGATLLVLTVLVAALVMSGTLLDGLRSQILVRLANQLDRAWRQRLLGALFAPAQPSRAASNPIRDLEQLKTIVSGPSLVTLLDLPWAGLYVLACFFLHPWLGVLTLISLGLILVTGILGQRWAAAPARRAHESAGESQALLESSVTGREPLLAMGAAHRLLPRILTKGEAGAAYLSRSLDRSSWAAALMRGLRSLQQVAILLLAADLALHDALPVGAIVAASMLFARAALPFERLASSWQSLLTARMLINRMMQVVDGTPAPSARVALPALQGRIQVTGARITPPGSPRPILADINFEAPPGALVAVMGPSGAGKTALTRLLVGLLPPSGGEIRLDGAVVGDWSSSDLGSQLGYLSQDHEPVAGTVADIIARFGAIEGPQVVEAAMRVGAHELILRLPNGYQTRLSRDGAQPSRSERQLINLARAFYGNPALLVLDEPTAHLDDRGEKAVISSIIEARAAGSTVLVVSRHIALLQAADHLLLLEGGRQRFFKPRAELERHLGPRLATMEETKIALGGVP